MPPLHSLRAFAIRLSQGRHRVYNMPIGHLVYASLCTCCIRRCIYFVCFQNRQSIIQSRRFFYSSLESRNKHHRDYNYSVNAFHTNSILFFAAIITAFNKRSALLPVVRWWRPIWKAATFHFLFTIRLWGSFSKVTLTSTRHRVTGQNMMHLGPIQEDTTLLNMWSFLQEQKRTMIVHRRSVAHSPWINNNTWLMAVIQSYSTGHIQNTNDSRTSISVSEL